MASYTRSRIAGAFQPVLDESSYYWLDTESPQMLAVIESLANDPAVTPENVTSYLQSQVGRSREQFVRACAGALRHIRRLNNE